MSKRDELISIRNRITAILQESKQNFRDYDEPEICKHLNSANESIDLAILCEMRKNNKSSK